VAGYAVAASEAAEGWSKTNAPASAKKTRKSRESAPASRPNDAAEGWIDLPSDE
jgi:hypothetical protein